MDIHTLKKLETKAAESSRADFLRMGIALIFMVGVLWYSFGAGNVANNAFLAMAAVFGAYMALNIGANDVANNVGPLVGSKALTMGGAIILAAIFEAGGALIAGGDVVGTIKNGIIDPEQFEDVQHFVWAMMAALLAGGIWLNLATAIGAPVSTTHSIVGGVMGGGIAAAGFSIVAWDKMGEIVASWVISPLMGAVIAAGFLFAIKKTLLYKEDRLTAMRKVIPIYVAIMAWAFATYLTLKGLKKIWPAITETLQSVLPFTFEAAEKPSFSTALLIGLVAGVIVYLIVKPIIRKTSINLQNTVKDANSLFTIPLIFAAALLSFAHGANDVANAVGPLAAIADVIEHSAISTKAPIPLWVMLIGAVGIALGLALYGPKLIKKVGNEITALNQIRAYAVAMAASTTVIIASQLGLPVSSTHIAIGGIFGVGLLREFLSTTTAQEKIQEEEDQLNEDKKAKKSFKNELQELKALEERTPDITARIQELKLAIEEEEEKIKFEKKHLKRAKKTKYIQRSAIMKIVAAWVITVPATAVIAAIIFNIIKVIVS
ncbi:MAG: inorganic phosphate transporter [Campylobacterales bacterium]|nr:inorganic phosphate transporter [Campylobacterales bacterium]